MLKKLSVFHLMFVSLWTCTNYYGCVAKLQDDTTIPLTAVTKGVYLNPIKSVFVYESNIPVTFVMNLPHLTTPPEIHCIKKSVPCFLVNKTKQLSDTWLAWTFETHPFLSTLSSSPESGGDSERRQTRGVVDAVGDFNRFLFGIATQTDITNLHVSEQFISKRQNEIKDALIEDHKVLVNLITGLNTYSSKLKNIIYDDLTNLTKTIESFHQFSNVVADPLTDVVYNQFLLYSTASLDSALSDCRNHLIPRSVLPYNEVKKQIKSLEKKMELHGYETATNLNSLFKLEVADCWFADSKLQVTLHIPIKKKNATFQLFEVVKIPYQWGIDQCSLMDETMYIAVHGDTVIPVGDHLQSYCQPTTKGMCYIPSSERNPSIFANCANAILKGSAEIISKECIFHCFPSNTTRVSEVGEGRVAVTNSKNIRMVCKDKVKNYEMLHNAGSVLLKVPW